MTIQAAERKQFISVLRQNLRKNRPDDAERNGQASGIIAFLEACSNETCALCLHANLLTTFRNAQNLERAIQALTCDGEGMPRDLGARRIYDQNAVCDKYEAAY